ncbi:MAG: hypothetical protein H0V17_28650 [Deltaproteobacteria bacterium]|nr:hypothetical protein [Deltaproteobacteria bacterium]
MLASRSPRSPTGRCLLAVLGLGIAAWIALEDTPVRSQPNCELVKCGQLDMRLVTAKAVASDLLERLDRIQRDLDVLDRRIEAALHPPNFGCGGRERDAAIASLRTLQVDKRAAELRVLEQRRRAIPRPVIHHRKIPRACLTNALCRTN